MRLAFDAEGCRHVQKLLQEAPQEQAAAMALDLRGHIRKAVESPHANHVIQKVVECLPASACGFVAEELLGVAEAVARHRYGCRVLCRLAEHHADRATSAALFEEVLHGAHYLCRNEFGKHVLNSILEHGTDEHRTLVAKALVPNLVSHATHRAASYVVERALEFCGPPEREELTSELLVGPQVMLALARSQAGCHVVRGLTSRSRPRVLRLLQEVAPELMSTKYGRLLLLDLGISSRGAGSDSQIAHATRTAAAA